MQIKAKYLNFIDKSQAQQVLLTARSYNTGVMSPLCGIQYNKSINNSKQSKLICEYIINNELLACLSLPAETEGFEPSSPVKG